MKKLKFFKYVILAGFVFLSAVSSNYAQSEQCPLYLIVSYKGSVLNTNIEATAIMSKTKESVIAELYNDIFRFNSLSEGLYKISVTKVGYKKTNQIFTHKCPTNENIMLGIPLYKGSSKQVVLIKEKNAQIVQDMTPDVPVPIDTTMDVYSNQDLPLPPSTSQDQTPKKPAPKSVSGGVLNGKAISLPKPVYPADMKLEGIVQIQVTIDENGDVESASAVSGHPSLRNSAVQAAQRAKFPPTLLSGIPVKVTGILIYNFDSPKF